MRASFVASVGIQAINMTTGVLLARGLGAEQRGALAAALLWPSILGVIGTLGIPEAVTFRVARAGRAPDRVVGTGLLLAAGLSVAFLLLGAALLPLVLSRQSYDTRVNAFLFLCDVPLSILALTIMGVLNGRHRYAWFHALRVLLVGSVLLPLALLAATGHLTARNAVLTYLAAKLVTLVAAAALLWLGDERPKLRWEGKTARELMSYGVKSHASGISAPLNQRSDQLLISIFLSPARLGIYVVAGTMSSIGWLIGGSVAWVALPAVAAQPPGAKRTRTARRFVSLTLALTTACCVPLIVFAPQIIDLFFGAEYAEAADISRILLVAVVVFATNRSLEAILRAVDRPLDAGVAEIIALAVTLAALAVLLPTLGLAGAALSSVIAALVSAAWMSRRAARALGVPVREIVLPHRDDVGVVVARARRLVGRGPRRSSGA
ncbi:MAG: oligosaccharide flippase family protein [Solirubrobacteraceae bacterium]